MNVKGKKKTKQCGQLKIRIKLFTIRKISACIVQCIFHFFFILRVKTAINELGHSDSERKKKNHINSERGI